MIHRAETAPAADMSGRILWQKIELMNMALGAWVRAGLSGGLVRDERRDKIGLVLAEGAPPTVREEWREPVAVTYLEMETTVVANIVSARMDLLPLMMELFEIEELVLLDSMSLDAPVDERLGERLLRRLREMGFRSPRFVLGRRFTGAVSLRYTRLIHKTGARLATVGAANGCLGSAGSKRTSRASAN